MECPNNKEFEVKSKECLNCKVKCKLREAYIKKRKNIQPQLEDVSDAFSKYNGKLLLS